MSFSDIHSQDWAWPADPTDLARIAQAENEARRILTADTNDDFGPEDLDWVAAGVTVDDRERTDDERLRLALLISQDAAEDEEPRRPANAEAERPRAEEDEETRLALSVSRVETEQADLDRLATEETERQQILEAERRSTHEARIRNQEREDIRKAELQSRSDERARVQAAREEKEVIDQAIVESKVAAERERERKAEELARFQGNYAVGDLSEEEQLQIAILQSRDEEHFHDAADVEQLREAMLRSHIENVQAGERSATQGTNGRPVLGAMASYPPGPVTEREQRSVADVQEFIENPNALFRPLTPIAETSESRPVSVRSAAGIRSIGPATLPATATTDRGRLNVRPPHPPGAAPALSFSGRSGPSIRSMDSARPPSYRTVEENPARRVESFEVPHDFPHGSQTSEDPPVYPGAYPPSPSQASSAARSTVGRSTLDVSTPTLLGAYPLSYVSSEAPPGDTGFFPGMTSQRSVVARRPSDNGSERFPGAYPPSSQPSQVPTRPGTLSSEGTFITAREIQPPHHHARPQSTLSDSWRHESGKHHQRKAPEPRPSFTSSLSGASSAVRPPSSRTSHGSVTRKPPVNSRSVTYAIVESRTPATASNVVNPRVVVSSRLQQDLAQYHFHAPVTVNNYNVPGESTPSSSLFKQVLTKGKNLTKGTKLIEHKNGAGLEIKGIAEAKNAVHSGVAYWKKKTDRFDVSFAPKAAHAPVSEVGQIDQVSVPEFQDDVGSIAGRLPRTQQLFVMNPDLSRPTLNIPETRRSLHSEFPMRQIVDVVAPRTPTLQRSVTPPPLPTITQRRPISPTPSTVSMILDVNGDAVTPPSDRQSGLTSSLDDSSSMDGTAAPNPFHDSLMPRPLDIQKKPPPVPRKPHNLAGSPSATSPQPPPRSRNPISRYMAQAQEGPAEWLQQPVQFPVMYPTQGPGPGSPDFTTATAPTPQRVNETLNRRSQYAPIDTNLANVPPAERGINEFNSRSMADLGRMAQVGVSASMKVLREQHEQTYARRPQERQERQTSDARAKLKEKNMQKYLREQR